MITTATYKKIYALVVVLGPILSQYSIGAIELDLIAMLLVMMIGILGRAKSKGGLNTSIIIFLIYVVIETIFNLIGGTHYSETTDIILRSGRYCLYIYFVLLKNLGYFDYSIVFKYYRKVVYLAFAYILIQAAAFYATGLVLPNKIGGSAAALYTASVGRFRSFYSEPAALAYGIIPFTVCSLFGPKYEKSKNMLIDAVISSGAIILSTSGQGVICLTAVWGMWLIISFKSARITAPRLLLMMIILLAVAVLAGSPIINYTIGRANSIEQNGAIAARISGYSSLRLLSKMQLLFGAGVGNYIVKNAYNIKTVFSSIYYSTIAEYLFTTGIIGTSIFVSAFVTRYRGSSINVKVLILATLILSFGGAPLSGAFIPLYLSLIFSGSEEHV